MAIDKKGSGRGKNWPTKAGEVGPDGAVAAKQPQQTPWSRRVQEAPKPLSAKHIATAKEKKAGKKVDAAAEGAVEAAAAAAPVEDAPAAAAAVASPAAGGKKRKAAEDKEAATAAPAAAASTSKSPKAAAKPSPSTKKSKTDEPSSSTPTASKKAKPASAKKADASPAPAASSSKAKQHFLKDDPIPLLKGLETGNTGGYHSTSEDDEDSSDDEDESDGEGPDGPVEGVELMKLPTIAKDDATVKRKLEKARKTGDKEKGVLYLGRIPHGFYETEMKSYFSQFGDVEKIRLARNKKVSRSCPLPSRSPTRTTNSTLTLLLVLPIAPTDRKVETLRIPSL